MNDGICPEKESVTTTIEMGRGGGFERSYNHDVRLFVQCEEKVIDICNGSRGGIKVFGREEGGGAGW